MEHLALDFESAAFQKGHWTLREQLEALARFLPIFTAPGFEFGQMVEARPLGPNEWTMPHYSRSPRAMEFVQAANKYGWVRSFDWAEWSGTPEGRHLRTHSPALEQATPNEIAKVLTALIRWDRFCEGALADAFGSGLVTRIVRRAEALRMALPSEPLERD